MCRLFVMFRLKLFLLRPKLMAPVATSIPNLNAIDYHHLGSHDEGVQLAKNKVLERSRTNIAMALQSRSRTIWLT